MNETAQAKPGVLTGAVLLLSLLAGLGYWIAAQTNDPLTPAMIAWKGAGVGLLALWAAMQARNLDGWLIALVMALGATGDVLLDAMGTTPGALAFMAGHAVAVALYLRNRRTRTSFSQKLLALLVVPVTVFLSWSFPDDRGLAGGLALYGLFVGTMAATAWISRFPRYWTGFGALLFVVSDLLIFSVSGPLAGSPLPQLLIWPCYFTGQALIAIGVVRTLAADRGAAPE